MGRWNMVLFCNFFVSLNIFQNEKFKNLLFISFLLGTIEKTESVFFSLGITGEICLCAAQCILSILKKRPKVNIVTSLSYDVNKCSLNKCG